MGEKKEWRKMEVDELIHLYRNKPELWDIRCIDYKNRMKKLDALNEIAEALSTSVEEINRKIHNLRNQFNSELKKEQMKKTGAPGLEEIYESKWVHFKALNFLQGGSLRRSSRGNFPMDEITMDHEPSVFGLVEVVENQKPEICLDEKLGIRNDKVEKFQKTIINDYNELMKIAVQALSREDDQYDIFGKFVASEMRNMKCDHFRKKMKRKIQKVILEINEEEEIRCKDGPTFSANFS